MSERAPCTLKEILAHPRSPFWVAGLAFLLSLPTLWAGWFLDDYLLRMVMLGPPYASYQPLDLFSIPSGDPELTVRYRDQGILPFWTPDNFRLAFFRPLTVLTAWLDFQLWPESPALMHLHSILWFTAVVLVAGLLYRSTTGSPWICGLAALLNALDPARMLPMAWISNRHVLLSTFFGALTLLLYDRWRTRQWGPGLILAPCAFALSLLAGEMGLATAGYLIAYALFIDRAGARSRVLALTPCLGVAVAWSLFYSAFAFGAAGSGTYVDPREDLGLFLRSFLESAPLLLASEVASIPADIASLTQRSFPHPLSVASLIVVALAFILSAPLIRASSPARFWALGLLLSLAPVAATFPSGRLLSFIALGAAPLLALFVGGITDGAWLPAPLLIRHRLVRGSVYLFAGTKLFVGAVSLLLIGWVLRTVDQGMVAGIRTIPDDDTLPGQVLVLLNPPDHLYFGAYVFAVNKLEGRPTPEALRVLAGGPTEMEVCRLDMSTLRVRMPKGLYSGPFGRSFRSKSSPLTRGEVIRVAGMDAMPLELNSDGDPGEMIYRFAYPLENYRFRWLRWQNNVGYVPFSPPAVGDSMRFPPSEPFPALF